MSTTSSQTKPALDVTTIRGLADGLPSGAIDRVLASFAEELARRAEMLDLLHAGAAELALLAHGLKGSAATFGATRLAAAAEALEQRIEAGDADGIDGSKEAVAAELRHAIFAIRRLLERDAGERR